MNTVIFISFLIVICLVVSFVVYTIIDKHSNTNYRCALVIAKLHYRKQYRNFMKLLKADISNFLVVSLDEYDKSSMYQIMENSPSRIFVIGSMFCQNNNILFSLDGAKTLEIIPLYEKICKEKLDSKIDDLEKNENVMKYKIATCDNSFSMQQMNLRYLGTTMNW